MCQTAQYSIPSEVFDKNSIQQILNYFYQKLRILYFD